MFRECFAERPYLRATRETQLSPFVLILRISVMCRAHASFRGLLSHELPVKTLQSSICLSLHTHTHTHSLSLSLSHAHTLTHSLSHTHTTPLQLNPTINIGYKRLNKITIKFGTELKPTKHIVVNYNFIISPFGYSMTKHLKQTLDLNVSLGTVAKLTHT